MGQTPRRRRLHKSVIVTMTLSLLAALPAVPAAADHTEVTAVGGSAFGYHSFDVSLFGGAQEDVGPTPTVTLASDASNSPQTATEETGQVSFGPGVLFSSGQLTVSTEGSLGADGYASSSADVEDVNRGGSEVFDADRVQSACTATADGASASTTITSGTLRTHAQASDHDEGVVPIPTNPEPGHTVEGHVHLSATAQDNFRYVFNEQIENADGSITVNAVHAYYTGPTLIGELIIGQSVCGPVTSELADHETGAIAGTVTDADTGAPIEGATVMADGGSATTGADGTYTIEGLDAATYSVTADADGYQVASQTATVEEGQTTTVDFGLAAEGGGGDGLSCGDVITENTTLTEDLGPCPGHGLIIGADNVVLNLGGFSIIGDPAARATGELMQGSRDRAGVLFRQVTGSMVMSGTVRGFDAGVAIMGGGNNTAHFMTLVDNINYRVLTGVDADPGAGTPTCLFGEGLVMFNSSGNTVEDNTLTNNGPISGIAMVGNSDNNMVQRNTLADHDVVNETRVGETRNTICGTGPEQGPMTRGRQVMDIGIRIEGPGAQNNTVRNNTVTRSALVGIAIHGYVCGENDAGAPIAENNGGNQILGNTVTRTGERTVELDSIADGIATLATGPAAVVCVSHSNTISGNTATDNERDGINLGGRGSHSNVVNDNVVDDNARNGISVAGPANDLPGAINNTLHNNSGHGNAVFDGADFNPDCDNNDWQNSDFGTVNQECVRGLADPDPGSITGTVSGPDGPIAGATVTAGGQSTTTAADGTYTIEGLDAGNYTVTASAAGFQSASQTATVTEGETTTVNFGLQPTVVDPEPTDDPEDKRDCMKGGWRDYGFKNQGQCIRFVNTGHDSR